MAFGSTIWRSVCHWVAPRASAPSRLARGTAASPSSVATMTTGTVSSARVSEAHRSPPVPKVGLGSAAPKKVRSSKPPTP